MNTAAVGAADGLCGLHVSVCPLRCGVEAGGYPSGREGLLLHVAAMLRVGHEIADDGRSRVAVELVQQARGGSGPA